MKHNIYLVVFLLLQLPAATQALSPGSSVSSYLPNTPSQHIYQLDVQRNQPLDIKLTTCSGPEFKGTIFLFDVDPITNPRDAVPVERSRLDHYCQANATQITLIYRLNESSSSSSSSKPYYVVIQATSYQQYNLSYTTSTVEQQPKLSWGLDRIDQKNLPLDNTYSAKDHAGSGVFIYVLDTGIRVDHEEFGGRAIFGYNVVENNEDASDCHGHGTHVAAIAGGATVGVAYNATIIAVKVLGCTNRGTVNDLVQGIDWVILDAKSNDRKPALVIASVATEAISEAYNDAIVRLELAGIPFVGSSGNSGAKSCESSPGSATLVSSAISVGATNEKDQRYTRSKSGPCTTLWAPGVNIRSADYLGKHAYVNRTGTSQAAPFVAGALALLLGRNPTLSPESARNALVSASTAHAIRGLESDDKDQFLFVRTVPDIGLSPPPSENVYFYLMLRFINVSCDDVVLKDQLAAGLAQSVKGSLVKIPSCSSVLSKEDKTDILFQAMVSERTAAIAFQRLKSALDQNRAKLIPYDSLVEAPWVVDSNGYTSWDPPRFENTKKSSALSAGTIGGIVGGCVAAAILIAGFGYLIVTGFKPSPHERFEGMHSGSKDLESGSSDECRFETHDQQCVMTPRRDVSQTLATTTNPSKANSLSCSPKLARVWSIGGEAFARMTTARDSSTFAGSDEIVLSAAHSMSIIDPEELLKSLHLSLGTHGSNQLASCSSTPPSHTPTQRCRDSGHILVLLSRPCQA